MSVSERFRIKLLKKAWERGLGAFLIEVLTMLINSGPIVSVVAYSKKCGDGKRFVPRGESEVVYQDFKTWEEIPENLKIALSRLDNRPDEGFEAVLKNRGWRLWIGTVKDQLAIYLWTRTSGQSADFFFPIGENSVLFWYASTLQAYRGMQLFPLALDHIIRTLDSEGVQTVYATCAAYNLASQGACDKNYFHVIGRGWMRTGSGRGIAWFPEKKLQEGKTTA